MDGDGDPDMLLPDRFQGLFMNLRRQLVSTLLARVGRDWELQVHAKGADPAPMAAIFLSLPSSTVPMGSGRLRSAPSPIPIVMIPQPDGVASVRLPIPNDPTLAGTDVRAWAVYLGPGRQPRRSNLVFETIVP